MYYLNKKDGNVYSYWANFDRYTLVTSNTMVETKKDEGLVLCFEQLDKEDLIELTEREANELMGLNWEKNILLQKILKRVDAE
jgi:hypothetical protein